MKKSIVILVIAICLFGAGQSANGAFVINTKALPPAAKANVVEGDNVTIKKAHRVPAVNSILARLHIMPGDDKADSGINGILALVFGVLGFFMPLFAIPAIILGAIGRQKGRKHQDMARTGHTLGVVVLCLGLFALLLVLLLSAGSGGAF